MRHHLSLSVIAFGFFIIVLMSGCSNPEKDWEKVRGVNTVEAYNQFINKYPDSKHVSEAMVEISRLQIVGKWKRESSRDTLVFFSDSTCAASFQAMWAEQPVDFEISEGSGPVLAYEVINPTPYKTTVTDSGVEYEISLKDLSSTPSSVSFKAYRLPDGTKRNVSQTQAKRDIHGRWRLETDPKTITIYVIGRSANDITKEFALFSVSLEQEKLKLSHGVLTGMEEGYYIKQY
jgi:hypothetical protein